MSFKRDGDDENLLKNLNHLRVKELLSTHIPQDEAKLLSNGRLACMICLHRPVFDTINMLALHRRGKRHLVELSKYIQCKEEAVLKEHRKRPHPDEISTADECEPSLLQTAAHASPMLGSKHSAVKHSVFRHRRKPILEIQPTLKPRVPVLQSTNDVEVKSASATVRHYLKSLSRKSSLEKVVEKNRENYGTDLQKQRLCPSTTVPETRSESSAAGADQTTSPVCKESGDHELKLRMSGWIKDFSGKWMKDPNVEFDSDEDETPT